MTDLHDLCSFPTRPIDGSYVDKITYYLNNGIPATYTVEEAYNFTNNIEEDPTTTTTPLHLICRHVPLDASAEEREVVSQMVTILFEHGAGWSFTDNNNKTPGCTLIDRDLRSWDIYQQVVDAGVRAELLLRRVNDNIEFISEDESDTEEIPDLVEEKQEVAVTHDPAEHQETYLNTKLEYKDDALITKDNKDGVMMSWETSIMKLGCDTLLSGTDDDDKEMVVLNIGFGMGIIDTMINEKAPTKHYICEAHPDVIARMKETGWFDKPNVVVLEGRWQDTLDKLLSEGVFFNGIYYDTFSEHYSDMLDLYDIVVGLLKPHGVFSFFNGLGADRQVIYEVYKKLVEIDLNNYGFDVKFAAVEVPSLTENGKDVWEDINRAYWKCPVYYHPQITFRD